MPIICISNNALPFSAMELRIETAWTPADVRSWARAKGIDVADKGRLPGHLVELYLARPTVIRTWARRNGLTVGERGRIPVDVVERYLSRPEAVRAWARDRNLGVGERGRVPAEVTAEYLARFGDLVRHAA
ncbi:MAG: hypothetical protein NVSMB12_15150 [Acidimicrobiales bacterium]